VLRVLLTGLSIQRLRHGGVHLLGLKPPPEQPRRQVVIHARPIVRGGVPVVVVRRARVCPGRKPPFLCVKRPARPYKNAIQKQIYIGKR
jgi:hypothetical protein